MGHRQIARSDAWLSLRLEGERGLGCLWQRKRQQVREALLVSEQEECQTTRGSEGESGYDIV